MQYYQPTYYYRSSSSDNSRGLLLPLLVGAAVGFPFGYIASNTSHNHQGQPYYPVYQQPYPMYQQPPMQYPMMPYPYMPY